MTPLDALALRLARSLDPERAHAASLLALRMGVLGRGGPVASARLRTSLAGINLRNPVGLAAGYDKNAVALRGLARAGFGFLEVGAATPRPQPGNPRPRLFRLTEDAAVINRFGFNNDGVEAIGARLAAGKIAVPVGLNLGANRDSDDRAVDYARVLEVAGPHLDFATVNVSSPNTSGLRDLQAASALGALLGRVLAVRDALSRPVPVFVKIAPDLDPGTLDEIGELALGAGVDGIVATNTTTARPALGSRHGAEAGGLSGAPLREMSTRAVARLSRATEGRLPIIGVGGVDSGEGAFEKITAGAAAVQLYTALAYRGLSGVRAIVRELDAILSERGFGRVSDAVGCERERWL